MEIIWLDYGVEQQIDSDTALGPESKPGTTGYSK
jgi:hypothetical protein